MVPVSPSMTGHHDERIEMSVRLRCDRKRVFEMIADPNQVAHYAARIEGAQVVKTGPDGDLVGSQVELITKGGNTLNATIKEVDPPRRIVWEDENGLRSTWSLEQDANGCVLKNILEGFVSGERARQLAYDADVKFQELARTLGRDEDERHQGSGAGDIVGTPRGPKKTG